MTNASVLCRDERLSVPRKLAMSAEILVAYARARRALRRSSLPAVVAAMRRPGEGHHPVGAGAYAAGIRLGAAVRRVLGILSRDPQCLTSSLVLTALLARRGIAAKLVIGVRPEPFAAHAWVEHGGRPLLPPAGAPFKRLTEV